MPVATALSLAFLSEQGVPTTQKHFCHWLHKARRVASTRSSDENRMRYENWVLNQIDDARRDPEAFLTIDWRERSAAMPADASVRDSPLVRAYGGFSTSNVGSSQPAAATETTMDTQNPYPQQQSLGRLDEPEERQARETLYVDCMNRLPRSDQQYLNDALNMFDDDVRRGYRSYKSISLLEMVQLTQSLSRAAPPAPLQAQPPITTSNNSLYNQEQIARVENGGPFFDRPPQQMQNIPTMQPGGAWNTTPYAGCGYASQQAPTGNSEGYRNYYGTTSYDSSYGQQQPNPELLGPQNNAGGWNGNNNANNYNGGSALGFPAAMAMDRKRKRENPVASAATPMMYATTWHRPPPGSPSFLGRDVTSRMSAQFTSFLEEANAASTAPKKFVGRSTALERKYSRDEPTVDEIRPLMVLKKAFSHIKDRFLEIEAADGKNVAIKYLSDQLKGMRQDIHVQGIQNFFTIVVYQTHARLALRMLDLGEFNQCQSALKSLYDNPKINRLERASISEFVAYRFAYLFLGEQYDALAVELMEVNRKTQAGKLIGVSSPVSPSERDGAFHRIPECVMNRPAPRSASYVQTSDIQWTMRLCSSCEDGYGKATALCLSHLPKNMRQLLGLFLQRYRIQWLHNHLSAFRGPVPWSHILFILGFLPYKNPASESGAQKLQTSPPGSGKKKNAKPSAAAKNSPITNLQDPQLFWIDGSLEEADAACTALFTTIKLALPHHHNFEKEVLASLRSLDSDATHTTAMKLKTSTVVAEQAVETIQQYLIFLRTRNDAKHAVATHS